MCRNIYIYRKRKIERFVYIHMYMYIWRTTYGNPQPVMSREREPPWGTENTCFVVATGLACSASILHFMFFIWSRDLPRNVFKICLRG